MSTANREAAPSSLAPPSDPASLPQLFASVAARFPHRPALTFRGESLTYDQLQQSAQQAAAGLERAGVRPGDRVAILMERSPDMIVAMLAVVLAGAAYLPLDPRYPAARIRQTLDDATPALVLVDPGSPHPGSPLTGLATHQPFTPATPTPDDTAYLIYTSGSTGTPKGVEVTHSNVVSLFQAAEILFHFDEHDVWTMFHSFAFDFSVWEIWGPLLTGGRLVLLPFETTRDPDAFRVLLARERVTVLNQTPSAFALLDRADAAPGLPPLALRIIIFGGEALAGRALAAWFARHGDTHPQLINMYGITETTVHVTHRRMRLADADEHESLLGEPIPGWHLQLLDEHLQPVPAGVEGELCISGAGVAKGYLRRPELTAERFLPNPAGPGRMYRSGDLAHRRPGKPGRPGELVYLGRRDGQVKIDGFRIETAEVEAALLASAGVLQACVLAREGLLVAYLVPQAPLETSRLRAELATRLPAHMLPSRYVPLATLPLNGNGKIDRTALPAPPVATAPAPTGSSAESRVARIWTEVLGTPAAHDDNFFDTGGTSLLLHSVRTKLAAEFARTIPITWMFECTTIRTLAQRLEGPAAPAPSEVAGNPAHQRQARQRQAFARARAARAGESR